MLTNSCVKLQTVHHIPLSVNKEGKKMTLSVWLLYSVRYGSPKGYCNVMLMIRLQLTLDLIFLPEVYCFENIYQNFAKNMSGMKQEGAF